VAPSAAGRAAYLAGVSSYVHGITYARARASVTTRDQDQSAPPVALAATPASPVIRGSRDRMGSALDGGAESVKSARPRASLMSAAAGAVIGRVVAVQCVSCLGLDSRHRGALRALKRSHVTTLTPTPSVSQWRRRRRAQESTEGALNLKRCAWFSDRANKFQSRARAQMITLIYFASTSLSSPSIAPRGAANEIAPVAGAAFQQGRPICHRANLQKSIVPPGTGAHKPGRDRDHDRLSRPDATSRPSSCCPCRGGRRLRGDMILWENFWRRNERATPIPMQLTANDRARGRLKK
jgi:hypothetical protein